MLHVLGGDRVGRSLEWLLGPTLMKAPAASRVFNPSLENGGYGANALTKSLLDELQLKNPLPPF